MAALALLGYCFLGNEEAAPTTAATAVRDAGPPVDRSTALVEDSLDIPDIEPDAGEPDAGPPTEPTHHASSGGRAPRGDWDSCEGDLPRAAALAEVRAHDRQFRGCYERRLRDNPLLQGSITLNLMVGNNGAVTNVRIDGTLHDREFSTCVRREAMTMNFAHPAGGSCAVIAVPYTFTPAN